MTKKIKIFDVILVILFIVMCFIIIIPIWKILVDSVDLKTAYGMRLFPSGLAGTAIGRCSPIRPFTDR